jgi:hypothetical protein
MNKKAKLDAIVEGLAEAAQAGDVEVLGLPKEDPQWEASDCIEEWYQSDSCTDESILWQNSGC